MTEPKKPRRPAMLSPAQTEAIVGDTDPADRSEIAHETARLLLGEGRARQDEAETVERLVGLVETEGLSTLARLWANAPAVSLPGALWRLYAVGEWVSRDPTGVARRYDLGIDDAEVAGAVAGVERPPGPDEVRAMTREVLSGMFTGDLGDQLDRTAAFLRVLSTGSAIEANNREEGSADGAVGASNVLDPADYDDAPSAAELTRRGASLLNTALDLERAARVWRDGHLE